MRSSYRVYGLDLVTNRPLRGLWPAPAGSCAQRFHVWLDVLAPQGPDHPGRRTVATSSRQHDQSGAPSWILDERGDGAFDLRYADGTHFTIDFAQRHLWVTWPASLTLEDSLTYLVGPVLGFVLRHLGRLCLHASVVAIGDAAVAFTGSAGAGKSTTAAAFADRGHAVLCDDIAALSLAGGQHVVQPGYPRVNLWSDSAAALFGAGQPLPLVTPTWDKHFLDLSTAGARFQPEPLPLVAVYVFGNRTPDSRAPLVEALDARHRLMALVANTYASHLLDPRRRASEFSGLGELVDRVPVRRVVPHDDWSRLGDLHELILTDVERTAHRSTSTLAAAAL